MALVRHGCLANRSQTAGSSPHRLADATSSTDSILGTSGRGSVHVHLAIRMARVLGLSNCARRQSKASVGWIIRDICPLLITLRVLELPCAVGSRPWEGDMGAFGPGDALGPSVGIRDVSWSVHGRCA